MINKHRLFCLIPGLLLLPLLLAAEDLVILNTTDLHARVDENSALLKRIELEEADQTVSTVYFDCGDAFQGSFEAARSKGACMEAFFRRAKCLAMAPGNHDLEFGIDNFMKLQKLFAGDFLAANMEIDGMRLLPWKLYTAGSWRIAVIGLAENQLDRRVLHRGKLKLVNEKEALRNIMPEIKKAGPDLIVLLRHGGEFGGREKLSELLKPFPEIDLVLGGHTHVLIPGKKFFGAYFAQGGCHGKALLKITARRLKEGGKYFVSEAIEVNEPPKVPETPVVLELDAAVSAPLPRQVNSSLSLMAAKAMKNFSGGDCAIFESMGGIYTYGPKITEYMLYSMFPYEDELVTVEITLGEWKKLLASRLEKVRKSKYGAIGYIEPLPGLKDGDKVTLAVTNYLLSGAGSQAPEFAEIAGSPNRKITEYRVPLRQLFVMKKRLVFD